MATPDLAGTLRRRWRPFISVAFILVSTVARLGSSPGNTETKALYDLVIRHGRVLDGAGNPWVFADVAIQDGKIVKIGTIGSPGRREIDAAGRFVSPGWIDMLDQSDEVLLKNGRAENKLRMGVTTAIGGEGGTPTLSGNGAPTSSGGIEDIVPFFDRLARQGISLNYGTYYNEAQARSAVLGQQNRRPTGEELKRMKGMMGAAMEAGVLGMSAALIYPPGSYASTEELTEMARVAGAYGGIYASHIRGEGKELVSSVEEAIDIGEKAGLPVEIFHFKAAFRPAQGALMAEAIRTIEEARGRGVDVSADVYPYAVSGSGLEITIPSWVFDDGPDKARARLSDPAIRARLKKEIETGSPGWWNVVEASGGWENIVVRSAQNPDNTRFEGKSIAEIGRLWGKHPADAAWDLVLQARGRVATLYFQMNESDVEAALRQPWVSIGSDGGAALEGGQVDASRLAHPRSYGTFPRIIARYVRDRRILSLEDAIRKMTALPANRLGLPGRGLIKEGFWADVVVFNLETIQDRATFDQPTQFPSGIDTVIVNGVIVIDEGRHTGARPGHVLYGKGRRPSGNPPR
jgi:N-acyl-D-amino-acid deacylase